MLLGIQTFVNLNIIRIIAILKADCAMLHFHAIQECSFVALLNTVNTMLTSECRFSFAEDSSMVPGTLMSHSARFESQSSLHDVNNTPDELLSVDDTSSRRRRSRRTCTWTGGADTSAQYAELAVHLGSASDSTNSSRSTPLSSVDRGGVGADADEKSSRYPPKPPLVRRSSSASDLMKERDRSDADAIGNNDNDADSGMVLSRSSLRGDRVNAPTSYSGMSSNSRERVARSVTPPSRNSASLFVDFRNN